MKEDKDRIAIQYLFETDPEQALRPEEIATILGLRGSQRKQLQGILRKMVVDGSIVELRPNVYGLGKPADLATGRLSVARSGVGFVTNRATGDSLRIMGEDLSTALPGDTVTVRRYHGAGDEARGKVIRIVERSSHDIVGTLFTTGRFLYVVPLDPVYRQDFVVPDAKGAREGDRVVVRLVNWMNRHVAPEGEVIDVIGPADKPSLDTDVVCRQFGLPGEFPSDVLSAAEHVAGRLAAPGKREDLRSTYILTVDPVKARDFDDALSFGHDDQGRRVLGVHIADVSHFVQPGSPLDEEAADRATSVYLVDKVIPMLPEQLSNGVCSLRPDEDRLCFSAFLTFDDQGRMVARRFAKTIIRSRLRLNYEQAMAILDGRPPEGLASVPPEAAALLQAAQGLARQLRQRRFQQGALDLAVPEVEVMLDDEGRMTGVRTSSNDESHQLIEECMVAANEAVATELSTRGIRILARLHEPPDPLKIEELHASLAQLGFKPGNLAEPRNMAAFLALTADHPLRDHAHTLVLRSMKRAVYSAEAHGHFGLAKHYYSHFTSPIRRYPDLVLHRQLAEYLAGEGKRGAFPGPYLVSTAEKCTDAEQRADEASRSLIEIKKFRFLQQQLDDQKPVVYVAAVSRVVNFGMFVDVSDLQMTGLIHITTISDQFVRFDAGLSTLAVGGDTYRLGQRVKVRVVKVDFNQRRADFALVHEQSNGRPKAHHKAPAAPRKHRSADDRQTPRMGAPKQSARTPRRPERPVTSKMRKGGRRRAG